ncbi:MAG: hypothetical protein ACTTHG_06605 [Treponemataceae bacterium]
MTVLDIVNITTENGFIYYRKNYVGTAIIQVGAAPVEVPVKFLIETSPIGDKRIEVSIEQDIHYPLLPIIRELKKIILNKHDEGFLPC